MSPTETQTKGIDETFVQVHGELSRRLWPWPVRALVVVTGLVLVRAVLSLLGRYGLGLRRKASASVVSGVLTVEENWTVLGRTVRTRRTAAPVRDLGAVRFENRTGYASLVVGFGFLVAGLWCGVHWILDGLGAGYPQLFVLGASAVLMGVGADLGLYLFVPGGPGRSRLLLSLGRYELRLSGVDQDRAAAFVAQVGQQWSAPGTSPRET